MHQKDCKGLFVATPMPSSVSRRALYGINRKRGLWVEEEAVDMSLKLHEVRGEAWMLGRFRLAATNGSMIFHLMLHTGKLGHGHEESSVSVGNAS